MRIENHNNVPLSTSISTERVDTEWDGFLEALPDNLYQQSSLWANVQAGPGWESLRMIARKDGRIVGGFQALLQQLPFGGKIGYISKGPVVASDDPLILEFILNQLEKIASTEHIRFLKIQPALGAEAVVEPLVKKGAQSGNILVTPSATVVVDLRPDPDDILAQMKSTTRYNIRYAERKGVTVRLGTEADIPVFNHISQLHANQRGYNPDSESRLYDLWQNLAPDSHFCLLFAEYEGEIIAARANIAFGDVLLAKYLVSDDRYKKLNAPSLLHWKAMLWGKEHGYVWYDFAGIKPHLARAMLNNEPIPDNSEAGRARFKKSFGGKILIRPTVYDISFVWPRRLTIQLVPFLFKVKPLLGYLIGGSLTNYVRMHNKAAKREEKPLDNKTGDHQRQDNVNSVNHKS